MGFGPALYLVQALCLAALLAAAWQDLPGRLPPYPLLSPPVRCGAAGGLAMIAGSTGLILLKSRRNRGLGSERMVTMDYAFLVLLDLASLTGMLLPGLLGPRALGALPVLHLAFLVALYATAPYGKFVHFVYRFAALVLNRAERAAEA